VKVDGRHADVLSVNPAASRLKVAAIVSDLGTGMFQASLGRFVQQLRHGAEIAIIRTAFGPERLVDYSADLSLLASALRRLGPMGQRGEYGSLSLTQSTTWRGRHIRRERAERSSCSGLGVSLEVFPRMPCASISCRAAPSCT
jgi:hypothetical protein